MSAENKGRTQRRAAALLSAALAFSPVLAAPAAAAEMGEPNGATHEQTADQQDDGQLEEGAVSGGESGEEQSQNVAQVTSSDSAQKTFTSLKDAVDEVNNIGGTLTLLANTSENITITHEGVTVTAGPSVVYSGTLEVSGANCTVKGMAFVLDPSGTATNSLIVRGATALSVTGNSFTIKPTNKDAAKIQQPNSIWIESGSSATISYNDFSIGYVATYNSSVAINIVGGEETISSVTVSNNTMTTTLGDLTGDDLDGSGEEGMNLSNMFFIIANGNKGGGIRSLSVSGNTVTDRTGRTGKDSLTWGIGVSGVTSTFITGNTIAGYVAVCGTGWSDQKPCDEVNVEQNTINSYYGVSMVKNNVKPGGLTVSSNNTFGEGVAAAVSGEAAAVTNGEGTCYPSVLEALNANEAQIVLEQNIEEGVNLAGSQSVTLDLAGHVLTGNVSVGDGCSLSIVDSAQGGKVTGTLSKMGTGALTISGGFFSSDPSEYLAPGYVVEKGDDGVYHVSRYVPPTPPTYKPEVAETEGGSVSVTPSRPEAGDTVTITPVPDEGKEVREVTVTDKNGKPVEVEPGEKDGTWTFEQPVGKVTIEVAFGCDGGELCPSANFPDVDQSQWYHDAVDWAVENQVFRGYDDGTSSFGPDDDLSRAQMAVVLWRLAGEPASDSALPSDCDVSSWYAKAVSWALGEGIFTGYQDGSGSFGPADGLTREQAVTVLWRIAGSPIVDCDLSKFPDAENVSPFALDAMRWAVSEGVLTGMEDEPGSFTLAPQAVGSRAQMAALLMRMEASSK